MKRRSIVASALFAVGIAGWASPVEAEAVGLSCDGYLIAADGSADPNPVVTDVGGYFTAASVVAPDAVSPGARFSLVVSQEGFDLGDISEGFRIVEQREFRYFFGVTGATVVDSSAVVTPATAGEVSATDDGFVLELSTVVPGGGVVTLPETRIEAVAGTTSEIIVSLTRFQTTLELARSDGSTFRVLSDCETQPNELSVTAVNGVPLASTGSVTALIAGLATALVALGVGALILVRATTGALRARTSAGAAR